MSELDEKVKKSIERLKAFEPKNGEGYYLAFSGGKDSVVLKALADLSGVKYHAVYRLTSVDPPELVRFIKEKHPDVAIDIPRYKDGTQITMWNLIPKKLLPPTRRVRYCCSELKETGGDGEMTLTGVRWAESVNRAKNQGQVTVYGKYSELLGNQNFASTDRGGVVLVNDNDESRRLIETCYKKSKTTVNPIIDWTDRDVWDFIRAYGIPYCSLYDEGWHRLGCVGCPMAAQHGRERGFLRWPTYKHNYLLSFGRMLKEREKRGKPFTINSEKVWDATPEDVFNWWMEYDTLPGQLTFDDLQAELESDGE